MTRAALWLLGVLAVTVAGPACAASPDEALHALFASEWDRTMRDNPTWASSLGDVRFNDRWPDLSLEAIEARHRHRLDLLKRLDTFDPAALSAENRLNLRLFRRQLESEIEAHPFGWHLVAMTARDGIQDENSLADALRFETVKDFEDWIARLDAFPAYMDQTIALLREGMRRNVLQPKVVMRRVPAQIARQIVENPDESLFYKPFRAIPDSIPAADRARLEDAARAACREKVVPSFRALQVFFEAEYLPACYDEVGAWQVERGAELYAHRCRLFTTTTLTPKEIHELGHREVRRIRGEMEAIVKQVGFRGTFREFLEDLRTNPKHYCRDADELLAEYRAVCRRIDPELPRLFKRLPKTWYGLEAIPLNIAPDTTTAYYRGPSADGRRPGTYFVNLYRPEVRPRYEMEALSLHEAVPGHHLQIALAMELELPAFRRYDGPTAYIEGWALYAEKLGEDLGLYRDPYSKFGQLTYEMWRAVRLVVDTGMHAFRWKREQAIEFFTEHTAKTGHDIANEVDRYIAWPGQALAYKVGELRIRELRARAEKELGSRFEVKEFHDMLLRHGAVPLDVLESLADAWIAASR